MKAGISVEIAFAIFYAENALCADIDFSIDFAYISNRVWQML